MTKGKVKWEDNLLRSCAKLLTQLNLDLYNCWLRKKKIVKEGMGLWLKLGGEGSKLVPEAQPVLWSLSKCVWKLVQTMI